LKLVKNSQTIIGPVSNRFSSVVSRFPTGDLIGTGRPTTVLTDKIPHRSKTTDKVHPLDLRVCPRVEVDKVLEVLLRDPLEQSLN
jgi:hypothetical protein